MSTPRKVTRGNQGTGREERRQGASPYSRPSNSSVQTTPSRLSGIINTLFSPFRSSASKSKLENSTLENDQVEVIEDVEITEESIGEQDEDMATVCEREIYRSSGIELEGRAPPSPSPTPFMREYEDQSNTSLYLQDTGVTNPNQTSRLSKTIPSSPAFSFRTKDFESNRSRTPQLEEYRAIEGTPTRAATETLALFFREKADAGNVPLNAIEEAGVLSLIQQAQTESLPTVFTPNFKSGSNSGNQQSNIYSPSYNGNYAASGFGASNSGSPSHLESVSSPYRRRRPVYVGAGYSGQSSRRRKQGTAIFGSNSTLSGDMRRSQSDGTLSEILNGGSEELGSTVAEGKKQKMDDAQENGLSRSISLGSISTVAVPIAAPASTSTATSVKLGSLAQKFAVATPVRPSPLWQVSKADTPSPSPPKKSTLSKPPTRAADIMMDIIRAEDATKPKISREAVLNPYESSENPIARIPRSRPARAVTPRKIPAFVTPVAALSKSTPTKEISPLQLLERTMPAELRRDDSLKIKISSASKSTTPRSSSTITSSIPPPKSSRIPVTLSVPSRSRTIPPPQAKASKKAVEVIEILDSSDEDEEEEEQVPIEIDDDEENEDDEDDCGDDEEDDEDEDEREQGEEEEDEEMEDAEGEQEDESEEELPVASKVSQAFKLPHRIDSVFTAPIASSAVTTFGESKSSPFPIFATSTPSFTSPSFNTSPTAASFSALSPNAILSTKVTAPAAFTFGIPASGKLPTSAIEITNEEARRQALATINTSLPTFSFKNIFTETKKEDVGALLKAFQDLAKEATKSELRSFAFSS